MDEFLVALMTGTALILYNVFKSIFEWNVNSKWVMLGALVVFIVLYLIKRRMDKRAIDKLGVESENYIYYQKYTSFGNKISYIFTYILQDFIYEVKKTNKAYNFSKGMFRFDDSLGEYYIDCRMAWYAYFRTNILKNRLSLHKLRIFSLEKCNQMLLSVFPEQKETYLAVKKAWENENNLLASGTKLSINLLYRIEESKTLHSRILVNMTEMEISRKFIRDNMERYQTILKKTEKRKEDIREMKNLHIDFTKKEQ